MTQPIRSTSPLTIGLGIGDRTTYFCALREREVVARGVAATTRKDLDLALAGHSGARVVLEAGSQSPWLSRYLRERRRAKSSGARTRSAGRKVQLGAGGGSRDGGAAGRPMLGEQSRQGELFRPDNMNQEHVGRETFYGCPAKSRHRLFRDGDFVGLYWKDWGRPSVPPSQLFIALPIAAGLPSFDVLARSDPIPKNA